MANNILITGGTGLVGKELTALLLEHGYNVAVLSRNLKNDPKVKYFVWDYENDYIDDDAIKFADIIIHLAGENISEKRWSDKQRKKIIDSRVKTTLLLKNALERNNKKLSAFISASAIGYYGTFTSEKIFKEDSEPGSDFLADVVVRWEKSVDSLLQFSQRIVKYRIGVVLSKKGGALPKIYNIVKTGLGSALGSGKQYMPWISLKDLTRAFLFSVENELNGVYNIVSTEHYTNYDFTKHIATFLSKPFFAPKTPSVALKLLYGEMASLLLEGSRISSEKIISSGFVFKDSLDEVLNEYKQK